MNKLFWNAYNSAGYKITSTYTCELQAWQGVQLLQVFAHLNWHYLYNTNTKKSDVNF